MFYEEHFGVQHLAQGHFGMQIGWEDWGSTFRLEDDHSTPSAIAAPAHQTLRNFDFLVWPMFHLLTWRRCANKLSHQLFSDMN